MILGVGVQGDGQMEDRQQHPAEYRSLSSLRIPWISQGWSPADDTTLLAENEEELKSPLIKVKEESEKSILKLNI